MPKTVDLNVENIRTEFLNFLRDKANSVDQKNRVSVTTDSQTYSNITNDLIDIGKTLSFIRELKVNGTTQTYGTDYVVHFDDNILTGNDKLGKIELLGSYNSNDTIEYTYGEVNPTNFVYPDFPRIDLSPDSYPRVGFNISVSTSELGSGGDSYALTHDITFSVRVVAKKQRRVLGIHQKLADEIKKNAKNFHNVNFITEDTYSDLNNFNDDQHDTHNYQERQYSAPRKKEVIQYA